ncbi:HET-domain-containing protein, partial [Thozetella sp. PMI_491]
MPFALSAYCYSPLPDGFIRLLRVMPHRDEHAPIQCQLFEYPFLDSGEGPDLYDALSYVWGSRENPQHVFTDEGYLRVTNSLYAALLHLRDRSLGRIIWIDAICINQENKGEKGEQILRMAEIYSRASRVIVWLGEAKNNSDQALEDIRLAADADFPVNTLNKQAILTLLQRPWFERIWVLQEVAAARSILIKCGLTEIDGYAFCKGLNSGSLDLLGKATPDLRNLIHTITYLIERATFRRKKISRSSTTFSLHIRPLGELIDMYHTREATERHDKVFALLSMSSDDPTSAGIRPEYDLKWGKLMKRLVSFILRRSPSDRVSIDTWDERATAVIKSKGCVLGRVEVKDVNNESGGGQNIQATIRTSPGGRLSGSTPWRLHISAKSVQDGDLICLLQGALKPMIIRLQEDHFTIVLITAEPPKSVHIGNGDVEWTKFAQSASFIRDFMLVWDW